MDKFTVYKEGAKFYENLNQERSVRGCRTRQSLNRTHQSQQLLTLLCNQDTEGGSAKVLPSTLATVITWRVVTSVLVLFFIELGM